MKILFVCNTDPRDTAYGGQQRTHIIWEGLKSIPNAEVSVLVPVPHISHESTDKTHGIYKKCYEKRYHVGWVLQRVLKKLIPYWDISWAYDWKHMHQDFDNFDVVVSRYVRPAAAFRLNKLAALYIDADDIHTVEYDRETEELRTKPRKSFSDYLNLFKRYVVGKILHHYQFFWYKQAKQIWIPDSGQKRYVEGFDVGIVPNIPCLVNDVDLSDECSDGCTLFFIGLMASKPNIAAIDWFLDEFWLKLKNEFPQIRLNIGGSGLPVNFRRKWESFTDVNVLGFVKDITPYYRECIALLTPMRIGSGSCIKVIESLRMGRCVLSTSQGMRGISIANRTNENGLFCFEDFESLKVAIKKLLDKNSRSDCQKGSRIFAVKQYSQEGINIILRSAIGGC